MPNIAWMYLQKRGLSGEQRVSSAHCAQVTWLCGRRVTTKPSLASASCYISAHLSARPDLIQGDISSKTPQRLFTDIIPRATTASAAPYSGDTLNSISPEHNRLAAAASQDNPTSFTDRLNERRKNSLHKDRDYGPLELRPNSKGTRHQQLSIINTKGNNLEKEQLDKDSRLKDDSGAVLPSTAAAAASLKNGTYINGFRPMNSRNNFLGGQGITPLQTQTPQRAVNNSSNTSSSHSRDSEELIATGTSTLQQPVCGPTRKLTNSLQSSQSSGGLAQMSVSTSRKFGSGAMGKGGASYGPSGTIRLKDITDTRYNDPMSGAPPTFQQRIAEINSLEQETIRYERSKKFKRKSKSET